MCSPKDLFVFYQNKTKTKDKKNVDNDKQTMKL